MNQPSEPTHPGRAGATSIEGSRLLAETSGLPGAGPTTIGLLGDDGITTDKNPSTKDSLMPGVNPCSTDPADPRLDSPRAPLPRTSSMLGACADDIASIASIKSGIAPAVPGMPGTLTGSGASSNISLPDTLSETDTREEEIGKKAIAEASPVDQRAGDGGSSGGQRRAQHDQSTATGVANGIGGYTTESADTNLKPLWTTDTTDSDLTHRRLPPVTDELDIDPGVPVTIPCWQNNNP